ncbi:hypothetical protein IWQ60_007789 [Tieghemiomyces parasiticus]|uniref:HAUS augmin-like complex subunit 3 N-terminal domain-containing protein n=1 Tax=Tieghemiomyces parasiticus TaxID=78921 RepID=A0A9W7ZW82_9FUNG|nr:hypothetical protein IWQ60_007789 [Tieghemiomyces parasiticus]
MTPLEYAEQFLDFLLDSHYPFTDTLQPADLAWAFQTDSACELLEWLLTHVDPHEQTLSDGELAFYNWWTQQKNDSRWNGTAFNDAHGVEQDDNMVREDQIDTQLTRLRAETQELKAYLAELENEATETTETIRVLHSELADTQQRRRAADAEGQRLATVLETLALEHDLHLQGEVEAARDCLNTDIDRLLTDLPAREQTYLRLAYRARFLEELAAEGAADGSKIEEPLTEQLATLDTLQLLGEVESHKVQVWLSGVDILHQDLTAKMGAFLSRQTLMGTTNATRSLASKGVLDADDRFFHAMHRLVDIHDNLVHKNLSLVRDMAARRARVLHNFLGIADYTKQLGRTVTQTPMDDEHGSVASGIVLLPKVVLDLMTALKHEAQAIRAKVNDAAQVRHDSILVLG